MRLGRLARRPARQITRIPDRLPRNARVLLGAIDLPAFVVTRHLDVLAWNDLAAALLGDPTTLPPGQRNVLAALFRDDGFRQRCRGWEEMVRDFIGILRAAVAAAPAHPRAVEVVGELSARSGEFRRLWARHDVRESIHGAKVIRHPRAGDIAVEWDAYPFPGEAGPLLIVMTPRSDQDERLRLLKVIADGGLGPLPASHAARAGTGADQRGS